MLCNVALLVCVSLFAAAPKFELYRVTDDPNAGIVPIEAALNEWRTPSMDMRDCRPKPENEVVTGPDFFTSEFGAPLAVAFTNGYSRLWGNKGRNDPVTPAIRIGRGWGLEGGRMSQLRLDIEQDVPTSRWEWATWESGYRHPQSFQVVAEPGRRTQVRIPLGGIRETHQWTAVELSCLTTNASGRIHSAKFVPVAVPVVWRGEFTIGFEPWKAGITVPRPSRFSLRVNGREMGRGLGFAVESPLRQDLTGVLHRGTNVLEYVADYGGHPGQLVLEAFAVDETGRTELMKLDTWRVRFEAGDTSWHPTFWSRTPGNVAGFTHLANDRKVATGRQPLHAGPIRVRHLGPKYPVYDIEEKVAWKVELPPRLGAATLTCVISNQTAHRVIGTKTLAAPLASDEVVLTDLPPGAYKLHWELLRGTNLLDRCRTQMVVAGPVEQTVCEFRDFDRVLAERMRLTQTVDCTKDLSDPKAYAENACRPNWPKVDHKTHVRTEKGITFREAGASSGDWFGYPLAVTRLGQAHILEVDYPDTREQLLYVAVEEAYPIGFRNNSPKGGEGIPNATGAVRTGWRTLLTNEKKTLRILFYPGSRNISVYFENGGLGERAAVCGFRLYEVPDGVPALKLPATNRLYGNHCERPIYGQWGASACGLSPCTWTADYENAYAAAYASVANRIRFLRYMGQNLAIDGVYMYKQGLMTISGESATAADDFDYPYVLAKMYRRNGIRAFACFEYLASPAIGRGGGYDLGDREVRAATEPTTPSHTMTRYGRQMVGFAGMGLNYLAPHVWTSITNVVAEVYDRYAETGGFEGLFVINNGWWIPGIPSASGDRLTPSEIGYDDLSVSLFEKETGIDLAIPQTPERFARRYEKIQSTYAAQWTSWRAKKLRDSMEAIQAICRRGAAKWTVYSSPCLTLKTKSSPYYDHWSSVAARDAHFANLMKEAGFPSEIWGAGSDAQARLVPTIGQALAGNLPDRGLICNAGTCAVVAKQDAVYLSGVGLNERWISTERLPGWWFRAAGSTVYDAKPSDTAAFADMVDLCVGRTPHLMVHTWLDVNLPTAHGRESRRFAVGYAATPEGEPRPFPTIRGVQAEIYPNGAVRLVNATPFALEGSLRCRRWGFGCTVTDAFEGEKKGDFSLTFEPYGMTVLTTGNAASTLSGQFRFADEAPVREARTRTAALFRNPRLCARIRPEVIEPLRRALAADDAYGLVAGIRDYEVERVAGLWFRHVLTAESQPAETMRVVTRFDGPEPKRFKLGAPNQGFGPVGPRVRSKTGRRTVSMRVRATSGREAALVFHDDPFRYDFYVRKGRFRANTLAFRQKPGQHGWVEIGMGADETLTVGEWHDVCWTVDPERACTLWVDGELVAAQELVDFHGLPCTFTGGLGVARPSGEAGADGCVDFEIERLVVREGVMAWEDICRESKAHE